MAHSEQLAARFRSELSRLEGVSEKRMMGGLCFFLNGHMIGGTGCSKTGNDRFMFRVGKPNDKAASEYPGAEPMVHGKNRMTGLFHVAEDICDEAVFRQWLSLALAHAASLPAKP